MTSACLFDWVAEHDLPLTGQFGETYPVDERDTDDLEDFRILVSLGITAIRATVPRSADGARPGTRICHPLDLTLRAIYSLRNQPAGAVARGPASGGMERSVDPAEYSSSGHDHTPVTRRRFLTWVGGVAAGTVAAVDAGQARSRSMHPATRNQRGPKGKPDRKGHPDEGGCQARPRPFRDPRRVSFSDSRVPADRVHHTGSHEGSDHALMTGDDKSMKGRHK